MTKQEKTWLEKVGPKTPAAKIEEKQSLLVKIKQDKFTATDKEDMEILEVQNNTLMSIFLNNPQYKVHLEHIKDHIEGSIRIITKNYKKPRLPPRKASLYTCEFTIYFPLFPYGEDYMLISIESVMSGQVDWLPGIKRSLPIIWRKPQKEDNWTTLTER